MAKDSKLNSTINDLDKELTRIQSEYKKIYEGILKKEKDMEVRHEEFPVTFLKDEKYEDLVLKASNYKHRSIQLMREATAVSGSCKADLEYLEAQLKLYSADTFLKEKFDKITDSLRNSFVKSKRQMRDLQKILKGLEAVQVGAEKLVRAFEADEVNFRRFHQLQGTTIGL